MYFDNMDNVFRAYNWSQRMIHRMGNDAYMRDAQVPHSFASRVAKVCAETSSIILSDMRRTA